MNNEETRRTLELERYFVVVPAFKSLYSDVEYAYPEAKAEGMSIPYNSANEEAMTAEDLREYLKKHRLLEGA